jgi:hypothetical protein
MPFLLAISVGNTRTAVGHFHGDELHVVQHLANGDVGAIVAAACEQWEHKGDEDGEVVIASVNDPVATAVEAKLAGELHTDVWRVGRDIGPDAAGRRDDGSPAEPERYEVEEMHPVLDKDATADGPVPEPVAPAEPLVGRLVHEQPVDQVAEQP